MACSCLHRARRRSGVTPPESVLILMQRGVHEGCRTRIFNRTESTSRGPCTMARPCTELAAPGRQQTCTRRLSFYRVGSKTHLFAPKSTPRPAKSTKAFHTALPLELWCGVAAAPRAPEGCKLWGAHIQNNTRGRKDNTQVWLSGLARTEVLCTNSEAVPWSSSLSSVVL